ncbi:hypothetical protein F5878DRAFT_221147 [Lentinula raphanica]|uniref:Uncharacterized protein n=1 Tax=Lentinula raphanica TaxID=153919 RepID=A0AA38P6R8_9AGAR|nr:hypothetical protein F5878DRAFT_221147 [Lentinula raphanica]
MIGHNGGGALLHAFFLYGEAAVGCAGTCYRVSCSSSLSFHLAFHQKQNLMMTSLRFQVLSTEYILKPQNLLRADLISDPANCLFSCLCVYRSRKRSQIPILIQSTLAYINVTLRRTRRLPWHILPPSLLLPSSNDTDHGQIQPGGHAEAQVGDGVVLSGHIWA